MQILDPKEAFEGLLEGIQKALCSTGQASTSSKPVADMFKAKGYRVVSEGNTNWFDIYIPECLPSEKKQKRKRRTKKELTEESTAKDLDEETPAEEVETELDFFK